MKKGPQQISKDFITELEKLIQSYKLAQNSVENVDDQLSLNHNSLFQKREIEENFLDLTTEIIISLDSTGAITYLNKGGHKILGYEKNELIGKNWFTTCIPIDIQKEMSEGFELLMEGEARSFRTRENSILCKDGKIKIIQWHNSILKDEAGKIIGSLSFGKDVSEWKQAEEQIARQSKLQQILIDLASRFINTPVNEVMAAIDYSLANIGSFIHSDRAYIFDYDWENEITINTYEWCAQGITPEIHNLQEVPLSLIPKWVETHIKGEKMHIPNTALLTKDDGDLKEVLEVQGIKSLLTIPMMIGKHCIGFVGFDSVKQYRTYSKIEEDLLLVFSEMLVNVYQRKKADEDLKVALEKAKESDRLKSAFLANMSHEIRTPMNGIIGFTNLLKKPTLSGEKKEKYVGIIEKSGKRMLNTINDIIDISRIEAGQIEVVETEFLINDVVNEQYQFFAQEAKVKGLQLSFDLGLSDADSRMISDKLKIEGVLTNLIKNAIKFTNKGKIRFGYTLVSKAQTKVLKFYVEDSGIGIPADRMNAIFNRFEQADIEDKMVLEGSGLGLSISKSYVEMLGGKIWANSEVGVGSTFYFTIPMNPNKKVSHYSKSTSPRKVDFSFKHLHVVIAEDDETNIQLFQALFTNTFGKIYYAKTGSETLKICREKSDINLILMDIKMPDMNGYDAAREIRLFNDEVVIIAQTAFGLSGDYEKAIASGCSDYISKPIQKEALLEIIKKHIDKKVYQS